MPIYILSTTDGHFTQFHFFLDFVHPSIYASKVLKQESQLIALQLDGRRYNKAVAIHTTPKILCSCHYFLFVFNLRFHTVRQFVSKVRQDHHFFSVFLFGGMLFNFSYIKRGSCLQV